MRSLFPVVALAIAIPWSRAVAMPPPPPDVTNCVVPDHVVVVGSDGSSADPFGALSVVIRDLNNTPQPNAPVVVSFANCPYVELCPDQLDPGVMVNCADRTLRAMTDAQGVARFSVVGAASPAACTSDLLSRVEFFWDNAYLGAPRVAVLDLNGSPGLTGDDLAVFLGSFLGCNAYSPHLDYNGNGAMDGNDLSVWLGAFFGGRSTAGCSAAPCP